MNKQHISTFNIILSFIYMAIFIFAPLTAIATETIGSIDNSPTRIESMERKIELLELGGGIDSKISNQLATTSIWLGILALVVAISAIGGGFYIDYKYKQVQEISKQTKGMEDNIERFLSEKSEALFKKLLEHDNLHMVRRLADLPEDVINMFPFLAIRELGLDCFKDLNKAYNAASEIKKTTLREDSLNKYKVLLLQHFPAKVLSSGLIKNFSKDDLHRIIVTNMFKREIYPVIEAFIAHYESDNKNTIELLITMIKAVMQTEDRDDLIPFVVYALKENYQQITHQILFDFAVEANNDFTSNEKVLLTQAFS